MRKYVPKDNVQAKAYYTDRYHVVPSVPTQAVSADEIFAKQLEAIEAQVKVKSSCIMLGQMIVEINAEDNYRYYNI